MQASEATAAMQQLAGKGGGDIFGGGATRGVDSVVTFFMGRSGGGSFRGLKEKKEKARESRKGESKNTQTHKTNRFVSSVLSLPSSLPLLSYHNRTVFPALLLFHNTDHSTVKPSEHEREREQHFLPGLPTFPVREIPQASSPLTTSPIPSATRDPPQVVHVFALNGKRIPASFQAVFYPHTR